MHLGPNTCHLFLLLRAFSFSFWSLYMGCSIALRTIEVLHKAKYKLRMKYLGSHCAHATLCLAWPSTKYNAMIQWANAAREVWPHRNIPQPEIDLGTVLECGCSSVPQAAANTGQNQEQYPRNAYLRGHPDFSRSSSPSLPFWYGSSTAREWYEKIKTTRKSKQDGCAQTILDSPRTN